MFAMYLRHLEAASQKTYKSLSAPLVSGLNPLSIPFTSDFYLAVKLPVNLSLGHPTCSVLLKTNVLMRSLPDSILVNAEKCDDDRRSD